MIDAELFEKLEQIARKIRRNSRPFGGIQLVLSGDFFQLPPVSTDEKEKQFCFQSPKWRECVSVMCLHVHRLDRCDDRIDESVSSIRRSVHQSAERCAARQHDTRDDRTIGSLQDEHAGV